MEARADAWAALKSTVYAQTGWMALDDLGTGYLPIPGPGLPDSILTALGADDLAQRVCGIIPDALASAGIVLPDGTPDPGFAVAPVFASAHTRARAFRCAILIMDADDGEPLSSPLTPGATIRRLVPYAGPAVSVAQYHADAVDDDLPDVWRPFIEPGSPAMWRVAASGRVSGIASPIHWTRVLPFYGRYLPTEHELLRASSVPALAILDLYFPAIVRYRVTQKSGAGAAQLAGKLLATVDNAGAIDATEGMKWRDLLAEQLKAFNVLVAGGGIALTPASPTLTGFRDLEAGAYYALSVVEGIPMNKLFTTPPPGFSTTDQAAQATFEETCSSAFYRQWEPNLRRLIVAQTGRALSTDWRAEHGDLSPESAMETAQREQIEAETAVIRSPSAPLVADAAPTYTIPKGAQGNARKVLDWRDQHRDRIRGMTATGWARARQLARGGSISEDDIRTIRAWFARHGAQKATRAVDPAFKAEPWRDAGYVSWLGWGGDTMRSYVEGLRIDAADRVLVALEVDPASVETLTDRVRSVLPDLDPDPWPHVTLLYLGDQLPDRALPVVERAAADSGPWPADLPADDIAPLGSDGAIVLHLRRRGLEGAQSRLLRALAPHVRADQYPRFLPHVTIGYLDRELTDADLSALSSLDLPDVRATNLVLRSGGAEIARWSRNVRS